MFTLILTLNGDYLSFLKWDQKFEYNEILREYGVIVVSAFNEEVKVMDNYQSRWMCAGKKDVDLKELKDQLDKNIRDLLKTHPELNEFTLDKIEVV